MKSTASSDSRSTIGSAERHPTILKIFIYSIPVVIGSLAALGWLYLYIFVFNYGYRQGSYIYTTADSTQLLTASQIITTIISKTPPIIVSILAYKIAAVWMQSSADASDNRPTPRQLGILMTAIQGPNTWTYSTVALHLSRFSQDSRRQNVPTPNLLRSAMISIGNILIISYGIQGSDTFFHFTSSPHYVQVRRPASYFNSTNFGRDFDTDRCIRNASAETPLVTHPWVWNDSNPLSWNQSCGALSPEDNFIAVTPDALLALDNSSMSTRVAFTDDSRAILVPQETWSLNEVEYVAETFGVQASCQSLTKQCIPMNSLNSWLDTAREIDMVTPPFNCTDDGTPFLLCDYKLHSSSSSCGATSLGVVDSAGYLWDPAQATDLRSFGDPTWNVTNPFSVGNVVNTDAYGSVWAYNSNQVWHYDNDTTFFFWYDEAWNFVYCDVAFQKIRYNFMGPSPDNPEGSFNTLNASYASIAITGVMALALSAPSLKNGLPARTDGAGIGPGLTYLEAFSQELSRELVAFNSYLFNETDVVSLDAYEEVLGTRIYVGALVSYTVFVLLYCVLVLYITVQALRTSWFTPFVELTQIRLTSSLPAVHQLFGPVEPPRTWSADGTKLFSAESMADRLNVGPIVSHTGDSLFTVTRRPTQPEKEESQSQSDTDVVSLLQCNEHLVDE